MTDTLVERLREEADTERDCALEQDYWHEDILREAADRIQSLEQTQAELKCVVRAYIYETTHLSPMETDGSHWCKISANLLSRARAIFGKLEPKT